MWDLVAWPGIKPGPLTLGAQSLGHWKTRKLLVTHDSIIARFIEYRFDSNAWRNYKTKFYLHVFCSLTHGALLFLQVFMLLLSAHFSLSHRDYLKNSSLIFYVPTCRNSYFHEPTCIWAISCRKCTKEGRNWTLKWGQPGLGYKLHSPLTNSMTLNKLPHFFLKRRGNEHSLRNQHSLPWWSYELKRPSVLLNIYNS